MHEDLRPLPHTQRGGPQDHGTGKGHKRPKARRRIARYVPTLAFDLQELEGSELEAELTAMADSILQDLGIDELGESVYTTASEGFSTIPLDNTLSPEDERFWDALEQSYQQEGVPFDTIAAGYGQPWMQAGLRDMGIDMTPSLRRSTVIDLVDPTEALDRTHDFVGFHVTTRP